MSQFAVWLTLLVTSHIYYEYEEESTFLFSNYEGFNDAWSNGAYGLQSLQAGLELVLIITS